MKHSISGNFVPQAQGDVILNASSEYTNQKEDCKLSAAGTPNITSVPQRGTPAQSGILQPYGSDTSSDRIGAWASPTLRALREKYGCPRERDPSVSTTLQSPSGTQQRTPQGTNAVSPFPLQDPNILNNLSPSNPQSAQRRQQGSNLLSSGTKRHRPVVNTGQRKLSSATRSRIDLCKTPSALFDAEHSLKQNFSKSSMASQGKGMRVKTVQIDEREYKSLPEYMQAISHQEMCVGLKKIISAYEEGAEFLTTEEVVLLEIPTSATLLHCLTTLEILKAGFSHGKVIYEPGARMLV